MDTTDTGDDEPTAPIFNAAQAIGDSVDAFMGAFTGQSVEEIRRRREAAITRHAEAEATAAQADAVAATTRAGRERLSLARARQDMFVAKCTGMALAVLITAATVVLLIVAWKLANA